MTSISKRPPSAAAAAAGPGVATTGANAGSVSVESYPCVVDDRYYLRRMKEILQDGLPKPSPPGQPDRVSGHVFIGNQRNADDTTSLRSDGIDHVLSCAASRRSTDSPYDGDSGIVDYFLIPAEDREDFDITRFFDAAFLFLDRVKRRRGKVLVHCNMGVNRSGAVVAAYLMVDEKRNLLDVISYLKGKRKLVLSNKGFRRQLIQFARSRGLLDPVVDTVTRISYMGDGKKGTSYETADEDEQRRIAKRQEGEKMADSEAVNGKSSLRKLMRELEQELKNGNDDVDKVSKGERRRNRSEQKPDTTGDELVQNGDDGSCRQLSIADTSGVTIWTRLTMNAEPSKKFSSSVQYWPAVADPVRASSIPSTSTNNIIANGEVSDEKVAVTKKRRSLRTRNDVERSNPEHQKTSTVFCTLRAKPKRNIEVRKRSNLADDISKLEINDVQPTTRFNEFPPMDFPTSSTHFAEEDMLSSTVTLRTRCLSSTAVDRPSSLAGSSQTDFNGFLVLLGKKIVHAKSSSHWNLTTQDREPVEKFLTSETRQSRVITRSRANLNDVPLSVSSFLSPSWQSVEKISTTARSRPTNVYAARRHKTDTSFANN